MCMRPGECEPRQVVLALTCRSRGNLTPIIERTTLAMFDPRLYLALGRAIAFQLVRANALGHVGQPFTEDCHPCPENLEVLCLLREQRHAWLDAAFQTTLAHPYRQELDGKAPVEPGILALAPCGRRTVT